MVKLLRRTVDALASEAMKDVVSCDMLREPLTRL